MKEENTIFLLKKIKYLQYLILATYLCAASFCASCKSFYAKQFM